MMQFTFKPPMEVDLLNAHSKRIAVNVHLVWTHNINYFSSNVYSFIVWTCIYTTQCFLISQCSSWLQWLLTVAYSHWQPIDVQYQHISVNRDVRQTLQVANQILYYFMLMMWSSFIYYNNNYGSTVGPQLFKFPLSEPLVIRTLFWILKSQKTPWLSAKPSNKWNACMIFRLGRLIIS